MRLSKSPIVEHPVMAAVCVPFAFLAWWFFDSTMWIYIGSAVGAIVGLAVEQAMKR